MHRAAPTSLVAPAWPAAQQQSAAAACSAAGRPAGSRCAGQAPRTPPGQLHLSLVPGQPLLARLRFLPPAPLLLLVLLVVVLLQLLVRPVRLATQWQSCCSQLLS